MSFLESFLAPADGEVLAQQKRYTRTEFARCLGVSTKTLERWENENLLVPDRYASNRPYYRPEHFDIALGRKNGATRPVGKRRRIGSPQADNT